MQGIDARGYLAGWLQGLVSMYTADINGIPDDKWNATFGGCTRPASELVADSLSLFGWCVETIKGNSPGMDGMDALKAACATKQGAIDTLNKVTVEFTEALEGASDETLQKEVMAPWQMPTPLFMMCQIAVSHIWYHDGQLNYIHCMLGDDKIYWMGG